MRVLFISSGNSKNGISPIVKNQGESLRNEGIDVNYFTIVGNGLKGYLKNVWPLRSHVKQNNYDIIHAHYSLSALAATLAGCKPLIVSLMGSDIRSGLIIKSAIKICSLFFWKGIIVKSKDMLECIGIPKADIIPNGVNTSLFQPEEKKSALENVGWNRQKNHILFAANPFRPEKNFQLFQSAYNMLNYREYLDYHVLTDISHQDVPKYLNASDVVVLTSIWEGSPNVIKEAMACNRPIVSTDVGDVRWVFGNTSGCYLASNEASDLAAKVKLALDFSKNYGFTAGRERLTELGLGSGIIAKRIINIYKKAFN